MKSRIIGYSTIAVWMTLAACTPAEGPQPSPPLAETRPIELEKHGHVRTDAYYWLRERDNPEVLAHLEAENDYLDAVMAHTEELQRELYDEIVGRLEQEDASVPFRKGPYDYYWRYPEGGEYRLYARRPVEPDADEPAAEQVLVDGNVLAEGHGFFSLAGLRVSSGHGLAAYAVDTVGRRKYERRFRDLATGEDLEDVIPDVTSNGAWANDDLTFFYTRQHPETLRWNQIYKHRLGTDASEDVLVYEEPDEEFNCFVYKTKSDAMLVIGCDQTLSSEYRVLAADDPDGEFQVVLPREADHEYSVDHLGDSLYVRTNWEAPNFRLMKAPIGSSDKASWREVVPHREDTFLQGFDLFDDFLVVNERRGGLVQMRIQPWSGGEPHYLDFGEPAYDAYFGDNVDVGSHVLRYQYTSLTTPESVFDYDMRTREKTLLDEETVVGDFDKDDYVTERLEAPARDGTLVPISLVYRKGFRKTGAAPLLQYGYGSYGASIDPSFSSDRLSLLDRGFVFAIAHIRGGQEMGRHWYEDGKLFRKMNTFTDFVDCGRYLVEQGYTSPDRLFAEGRSAGGLLMGAVTNLAPELYHGIISHVAFVDVVTTMLDESIPLTTSEYDEWGNPNEKDYYDYMLSYSPYDNLESKEYPHILLTTALADSQVQYWEPAKYAAKLRSLDTGNHRLLLRTHMEAGHGGASGRFKQHEETALVYAFMLDLVP
jgi:oligopeptidase B